MRKCRSMYRERGKKKWDTERNEEKGQECREMQCKVTLYHHDPDDIMMI